MLEKLSRRATGIGSLPDIGEAAALKLIRETFPFCPHWPQFPVRPEEYFLEQVFYPLKEMGVMGREEGNNPRFFNLSGGFWERVGDFYQLYLENKDSPQLDARFMIPPGAARGFYALLEDLETRGKGDAVFVKGQAVAPLTAGMQVLDQEGHSAFFNQDYRDIMVKALELHLVWQVRELKKTGLPVIIFLDEGMMQVYGNRDFLSLKGDWISDSFRDLTDTIRREGAFPGIHACSAADWNVLLEGGPAIINLDAYNYHTSLLAVSDRLDQFLQGGGYIAWGIVPVSGECFQETPASLRARLDSLLESLVKRGIREEMLQGQMIITPSCGTGLYPPEQANRVYQLTRQLVDEIG